MPHSKAKAVQEGVCKLAASYHQLKSYHQLNRNAVVNLLGSSRIGADGPQPLIKAVTISKGLGKVATKDHQLLGSTHQSC